MAVCIDGTIARLDGDWTITGIAENISAIVHLLNQMEHAGEASLQIDCEKIDDIDSCGLQLINVWMFCARLRGIESELINMSDGLQRTIRESGFRQSFSGSDRETTTTQITG